MSASQTQIFFLFLHLDERRSNRDYFTGASHSWVPGRRHRAIWSLQAGAASSSSQASADLALHSYSPHVCVCVVQIGWRQWWHSQSCGWLVFSKVAALPPLPWTGLRKRCWVGSQSHRHHWWKGEASQPLKPLFRQTAKEKDSRFLYFSYTFFTKTEGRTVCVLNHLFVCLLGGDPWKSNPSSPSKNLPITGWEEKACVYNWTIIVPGHSLLPV